MKKETVIDSSLFQVRPMRAVWAHAIIWLFLDRFQAPEWAFGAFWLWAVLSTLCLIAAAWRQQPRKLKDSCFL